MTGVVNAILEATFSIGIVTPSGSRVQVDCIIDTGFTGALTLPHRLISSLKLEWLSIQNAELADGRIVPCDVYLGTIAWNDGVVDIEVDAAETSPLIGMALLRGFEVSIQVREGGAVRITELQ